jgi:hypothetical protein
VLSVDWSVCHNYILCESYLLIVGD